MRTSNILLALGFSLLAHVAILVGGTLFSRNDPISFGHTSVSVELSAPFFLTHQSRALNINYIAPRETKPESASIKPEDHPASAAPAATSQAATPRTQPSMIYTPNHLTRAPRFRNRVEATYPTNERAESTEVQVLAEAVIDTNGHVVEATIIESAGSNFDAAAITALRQSTFVPGYLDLSPVSSRVQISFRFKLK